MGKWYVKFLLLSKCTLSAREFDSRCNDFLFYFFSFWGGEG